MDLAKFAYVHVYIILSKTVENQNAYNMHIFSVNTKCLQNSSSSKTAGKMAGQTMHTKCDKLTQGRTDRGKTISPN